MPSYANNHLQARPPNTLRVLSPCPTRDDNWQKFAAYVTVLALIVPSQLSLNQEWQTAFGFGIAAFTFVFTALTARRRLHRRLVAHPMLVVLSSMVLAAVASAIRNDWAYPIFVYGGIAVVFFTMLKFVSRVSRPMVFVRHFVTCVMVTTIVLCVACLFVQPPSLYRYQGLFHNPNSMGWFATSAGSLAMGMLASDKTQWSKFKRSLCLVVFVVCIGFVFSSNCSSGAVAIFTAAAIIGLRQVDISFLKKGTRSKSMLMTVFLFGVLSAASYYLGLLDRVIEKFEVTMNSRDISQGRLDMWSYHFERWTWFGHGDRNLYSSHSTFVSHISRFGALPTALFVAFLSMILVHGYRKALTRESETAVILMPVITSFVVQAIFETGVTTPGLWIAITLVCASISEVSNTIDDGVTVALNAQRLRPTNNTLPKRP